jgi:ubiquinol-cytochrome c reductase cytochrome c1 subunit
MKKLFIALLFAPLAAHAATTGYKLDHAPIKSNDLVSLQAGARTFVNYCLNCHSAQYMRYNRLTDLGLTEAQIKDNLMFAADKVGETMKVSMSVKDGKAWFGVPPPDLSVVGRSRGADWLYTYLRTFYRDPTTATGWNNPVFQNSAMPHVLWTLQGERHLEMVPRNDGAGVEYKWSQLSAGAQSAVEYDHTVLDLVNFLVYVGEPSASSRTPLGVVVLLVLGIVFVFAYAMKREFWKDVKH